MCRTPFVGACFLAMALSPAGSAGEDPEAQKIIALERAALDRWGKGDPKGYLAIYAPEITYFDPYTASRLDGYPAIEALYLSITGKVQVERFDMNNPKVQRAGDMAVLTFNLVSHIRRPNGERASVGWNSTEVYQRSSGTWKMVHSHWSYTKPQLTSPVE